MQRRPVITGHQPLFAVLALLDSNWFYNMLGLALKNIQTTLMDSDWFYDILDLDLKKITLLDLNWFY